MSKPPLKLRQSLRVLRHSSPFLRINETMHPSRHWEMIPRDSYRRNLQCVSTVYQFSSVYTALISMNRVAWNAYCKYSPFISEKLKCIFSINRCHFATAVGITCLVNINPPAIVSLDRYCHRNESLRKKPFQKAISIRVTRNYKKKRHCLHRWYH